MASATVPQQLAWGVTMASYDEMTNLCDSIVALFDVQSATGLKNLSDDTPAALGNMGLIAAMQLKRIVDEMQEVREGGAK